MCFVRAAFQAGNAMAGGGFELALVRCFARAAFQAAAVFFILTQG